MRFESTDWTALFIARNRSDTVGAEAFAQLIVNYQPAMVFHVQRQFRLQPEFAEELVQQFVLDRLLEQNLLEKADRRRGKFRALLVTALNHYCLDWFRRRSNKSNLQLEPAESETAVAFPDPFDRAWAESILTEALARTKRELCDGGREKYWELFDARVVQASYGEQEHAAYEELCLRLGFGSPRDASNALTTAKRSFERAVMQLLEAEDGSAAEKLGDLHQILSTRAALTSVTRRTE